MININYSNTFLFVCQKCQNNVEKIKLIFCTNEKYDTLVYFLLINLMYFKFEISL